MTDSTGSIKLGLGVRFGFGLGFGFWFGRRGGRRHFARTTTRTLHGGRRCSDSTGGGELVQSCFKLLVLLLQGDDLADKVTKVLIQGGHVVFGDIAAFQDG